MRNALKVAVTVGLLAAGGAFAQGTTSGTKGTASASKPQSKQLVMDAKMHEQMMNDIKKMQAEIESLRKQLAEERKRGMDPAHHAEMMAEQKTSDQKIDALQKTAKDLYQQVEQGPKYLDQGKGPVTGP